jgi:hypothetical protein
MLSQAYIWLKLWPHSKKLIYFCLIKIQYFPVVEGGKYVNIPSYPYPKNEFIQKQPSASPGHSGVLNIPPPSQYQGLYHKVDVTHATGSRHPVFLYGFYICLGLPTFSFCFIEDGFYTCYQLEKYCFRAISS